MSHLVLSLASSPGEFSTGKKEFQTSNLANDFIRIFKMEHDKTVNDNG